MVTNAPPARSKSNKDDGGSSNFHEARSQIKSAEAQDGPLSHRAPAKGQNQ